LFTQKPKPDDIVTKADINKCLKHIRKTEGFLYPQSLKVETAKYTIEDTKILLTLSISEKPNTVDQLACKINNAS